jgi:hypothetical protein
VFPWLQEVKEAETDKEKRKEETERDKSYKKRQAFIHPRNNFFKFLPLTDQEHV